MDHDGSGMIDVEELSKILEAKGIEHQKGGLEQIIAEMDHYGTK